MNARESYRAAARRSSRRCPTRWWWRGNARAFGVIGYDGAHPTDSGFLLGAWRQTPVIVTRGDFLGSFAFATDYRTENLRVEGFSEQPASARGAPARLDIAAGPSPDTTRAPVGGLLCALQIAGHRPTLPGPVTRPDGATPALELIPDGTGELLAVAVDQELFDSTAPSSTLDPLAPVPLPPAAGLMAAATLLLGAFRFRAGYRARR